MKAFVLRGITETAALPALRVEQVSEPTPGAGEVVVRLKAAALNHRDLFISQGSYAGLKFPIIPGSDGVGTVAAVGTGVTSARVGAAVIINPTLGWGDDPGVQRDDFRILGLPDDGTFAELVKVPTANVAPRPAGLSDEEAAVIPLGGLTAYRAVVTRGQVRSGETVLITGAGGGVASLALLIARQRGARVLVTSRSDAKLARARELGADEGFNSSDGGWVKAARAASGGRGPDVVIDSVGGETFNKALDVVRPGGRVVTYGSSTGNTPDLVVRRVFWKQLTILGSTMGSPADFAAMLALFGVGGLRPVVDRVFALDDTGMALAHMASAEQFGKIALAIG